MVGVQNIGGRAMERRGCSRGSGSREAFNLVLGSGAWRSRGVEIRKLL